MQIVSVQPSFVAVDGECRQQQMDKRFVVDSRHGMQGNARRPDPRRAKHTPNMANGHTIGSLARAIPATATRPESLFGAPSTDSPTSKRGQAEPAQSKLMSRTVALQTDMELRSVAGGPLRLGELCINRGPLECREGVWFLGESARRSSAMLQVGSPADLELHAPTQ
jgi:hypothetical protein